MVRFGDGASIRALLVSADTMAEGILGAAARLLGGSGPAFMPLQIASEPAPVPSRATETAAVGDKVEIMLTNGRRLSVSTSSSTAALLLHLRVIDPT